MAKTVLIVEDERAIVEILKFNLKREGYETLEALDGETGLQLAQTKDPDLILLDVMLPKMNGFEVCEKIRLVSQVPIIFVTAREETSIILLFTNGPRSLTRNTKERPFCKFVTRTMLGNGKVL